MELNVHSRRVYDGYATIRSRGRSRPRAVYRSDSEELLKESVGPYALPKVSNVPLSLEDVHRVPRWSEAGEDRGFLENYGTLRGSARRNGPSEGGPQPPPSPHTVTLNTFSGRSGQGRLRHEHLVTKNNRFNCPSGTASAHYLDKKGQLDQNGVDESRLYDSVPVEDYSGDSGDLKSFGGRDDQSKDEKCLGNVQRNREYDRKRSESFPACKIPMKEPQRVNPSIKDVASMETCVKDCVNSGSLDVVSNEEPDRFIEAGKVNQRDREIVLQNGDCYTNDDHSYNHEKAYDDNLTSSKPSDVVDAIIESASKNLKNLNGENNAGIPDGKGKQPIYAVPNVFSKSRREEPVIVDENYVPSGDLYCTTAKYIEDINRNLAEIDKSYEQLKLSTNTKNSAYGVINKIAKASSLDSDSFYGYRKKRDMAPMPPISPSFGEAADEKVEKAEFDCQNQLTESSFKGRPNSYGKFPPKPLPRSSSIESTARHSTGSSTLTTSTKSSESLYAISESLTSLDQSATSAKSSLHRNANPEIHWTRERVGDEYAESDGGTCESKDEFSCALNDYDCEIKPSRYLLTKDESTRSANEHRFRDCRVNSTLSGCVEYSGNGDISSMSSMSNQKSDSHGYRCAKSELHEPDGVRKRRSRHARPLHKSSEDVLDSGRRSDGSPSYPSKIALPERGKNIESVDESYAKRRYGTLPDRRSRSTRPLHKSTAPNPGSGRQGVLEGTPCVPPERNARRCSRPLHKSSEDVLDAERSSRTRESFRDDLRCLPRRGTLSESRDVEGGAGSDNLRRNYGTLPSRYSRSSSRPLHKSSEDMLEDRVPRDNLPKSSSANRKVDLSLDDNLFLLDATDVILKGQLERNTCDCRKRDIATMSLRSNDRLHHGRTRHNSLESEDDSGKSAFGGFATLPRRNLSKDEIERGAGDTAARRLSGNVPILEPLYEHAVSDPVKPRSPGAVIPWWELATRKYRHRSCPSLQAHVVSAFEQSLSNMTQRLQQLTATAEKKDSELQELRETIERLRKQSAEAGLNNGPSSGNGRRHTLGDSDSGTTGCTGNSNSHQVSMARQLSADSVASLNSLSSACSASSHHKKKGWLRSSFSKAFSRSRKNRHGSVSDAEDCKESSGPGDLSAPNSPRLPSASKHDSSRQNARNHNQASPEHENPLTGSKSSSALYKKEDEDVDELKKQLREKDLVLTDIRLEALSSAHQLESLKDTVIKMRNEMLNLKQNNERLQRLVTSKSLTSSQSSLPSDPERRFSMTEVASTVAALSNGDNTTAADQLEDLNVPEHPVVPSATATSTEPAMEQDTDGKRINVAIYLGSEKNFNYNLISGSSSDVIGEPPHCVIANVCISNKTSWDALDSTVRRCFKEYVSRVDPVTNLGLGVECLAAYHLGEASRCITDSQHPELLPCGYLVGHVKTIYLVLSGYSWLAVDTLIPRSIVQRLISLLTEHRRVILCGPSGTGKSYLAGKLAHALVDTDSDAKDAAAVATFNVDHKSSKELRQYLAHIAERCDSNAADELPRVIILENLQHAASLGELFSGLLGTRHSACPAIIGTMSQATCSTTNLQLHHNFRWVLCANHMEPVKGFLGRYLRRKLLEHELRETGGIRNAEMAAVVEWLPRVWLHLNKFLETHSSSDVTIGPRLFLSCPMEVAGSQVWFTDLWNYSVIPYLVEAVREGLTLYGRRISGNGNGDSTWEDPAQFITSSYPWLSTHAVHGGSDALLRLRPEDVGYDVVSSSHTAGVGASSVKSLGSTHSDTEGDPLLNMLMRLQEAANYSSPHSNDSDSVTSLDSSHTRHSEDLSSSTSSSRGVESAL